MLKVSTATANAALNGTGFKEQFDGGLLYLYAGPVPADADVALDMSTLHTEAVIISESGSGDGLTFDAPAGGVLGKAASETWSGVPDTNGYQGSLTTIAPTFYRFCAGSDNGRGAANTSTGYRVQGTVGGPNSGADLQLGNATVTEGVSQPVGAFSWTIGR
jgi:hypothetical protein